METKSMYATDIEVALYAPILFLLSNDDCLLGSVEPWHFLRKRKSIKIVQIHNGLKASNLDATSLLSPLAQESGRTRRLASVA